MKEEAHRSKTYGASGTPQTPKTTPYVEKMSTARLLVCNFWLPCPLLLGSHSFAGCQGNFSALDALAQPIFVIAGQRRFPMTRTRLLGIPMLSILMLVMSAFPTQALAPATYYIADT